MIQLYRVTVRFPNGIEALREVTVRVHEGELAFVSGRSGAGKTTLVRLVTAHQAPTDGQILVAGRNLAVMKAAQLPFFRRGIGTLWQDVRLLPDRSVRDNVALPLEIVGVDPKKLRHRVDQVLEMVGLERLADAAPAWLSALEKQKAGIARAIVNEPALIVADEPTGDLDPESAVAIVQMLRDLRARGTTVLIATHDRQILQRFGERVILLNKGFLIEDTAAGAAPREARGPVGEAQP
ncbi:MAG: ATP-binding cassette domain-containing protein [Deltaproteobacteria bacterium]|nr:ATP-binding cassette domain-containing protein [Deltaproteobacteria bacterium]